MRGMWSQALPAIHLGVLLLSEAAHILFATAIVSIELCTFFLGLVQLRADRETIEYFHFRYRSSIFLDFSCQVKHALTTFHYD